MFIEIFLAVTLLSIFILWYMCATAPYGYEDEQGFHYVPSKGTDRIID